MNTLTKTDLEDLTFLLEDIVKRLPKLKLTEKVDVAARLRGAAKAIKAIDDDVKKIIKEKRDGVEGYVNGELWRAKLSMVPVNRFQQAVFKEADPKTYDKYCKSENEPRVTFEVR